MNLIGWNLAAPAFVVIGLFIRFLDGGPVLFWKHHVGQGGKHFNWYPFRTMRSMPPGSRHAFAAGNVTRLTLLGKIWRKTRIDELPWLWNLLCGDRSLSGPRPEVERGGHEHTERWAHIDQIRPGISDPPSIASRHDEALLPRAAEPEAFFREAFLPQKLAIHGQYLNQRSFWSDHGILLMKNPLALISRHDRQEIDGVGR